MALHSIHQLTQTDLAYALKGGGSNFGIVTAYTLQTHDMNHKVWGGNFIFTHDKTPDVIKAIHNFVGHYPDDKAAIIGTFEHATFVDTWIMFLFYDGPSPPEGVFDEFKNIGPLDTTKTWDTYYDLVCYHPLIKFLR